MFGLELGLGETRTKRFGTQKPGKTNAELIKGVRQSTNAESTTAIKATKP